MAHALATPIVGLLLHLQDNHIRIKCEEAKRESFILGVILCGLLCTWIVLTILASVML